MRRILAFAITSLVLSGCAVTQPAAQTVDLTPINTEIAALQASVAAIPPPTAPVDLTAINAAIAALQAAVAAIPKPPDLTPYATTAQLATVTTTLNAFEASYIAQANAPVPLILMLLGTNGIMDFPLGVSVTYASGIGGGIAPYTVTASGMPDGIAVNSFGMISGTATMAGTGVMTYNVTDSTGTAISIQQPWTVE